MDDLYAINVAKTEFREGFNLGDAARILAIRILTWLTFRASSPADLARADWMVSQLVCRVFSSNLR